MRVLIRGPAPPLRGRIRPPPDKSITHRALLLAALAEGESSIHRPLDSADTRATLRLVEAFGASIDRRGGAEWTVRGPARPNDEAKTVRIDCAASGSTARMGIGWILALGGRAALDGDPSLRRRPMARVTEPLRRLGARFGPVAVPERLPLEVLPSPVRGGRVEIGVASAQVATAIALAALGAAGPVTVSFPTGARDHTWRLLPAFGAGVDRREHNGLEAATIRPGLPLRPATVEVPGDPSSALYAAVLAAAQPGSAVRIEGVSANPTRTHAFGRLAEAGATLETAGGGGPGPEPACDLVVRGAGTLRPFDVVPAEVPTLVDEIPALAALASRAPGRSTFRGLAELRVKESDRLAATAALLSAFGVPARIENDDLAIEGGGELAAGRVEPRGDHRIAMAGAVLAALAPGESTIEGAECVAQSYPGFFDDLRAWIGAERVRLVT